MHGEHQPGHLGIAATDSGRTTGVEEYGNPCERFCPAAVYEHHGGELVVNFSNCVDCKTTDVLGPRWRPREGGAGTKYKRM